MTKEQAIKLLRKETSPMEIHILTIEGLKQSEIIDKIQEAMNMGIDALEKQTWISVKDRLPEKEERYIVNAIDYRDEIVVYDLWFKEGKWYIDDDCNGEYQIDEYDGKVLYWMPLPKPYKETL
jgi:hypothetical protein